MYGNYYNGINYKQLLPKQLEIWQWVLGCIVQLDEKICNTLRADTSPGCWLEEKSSGWIRLQDYANSTYHNISCFDAVMLKYSCTFREAIEIIASLFTISDLSRANFNTVKKTKVSKTRSTIKTIPRHFTKKDQLFWQPLEITSDDLIKDKVVANKFIQINHQVFLADSISYTYTFDTRKKIYQPFSEDKKWFSNVKSSDIWGLDTLESSDICIIAKAYKDARIIKNLGYEVIATQNESMYLTYELIQHLDKMFPRIYLLYDNDKAGIEGAIKVAKHANEFLQEEKFFAIHLPIHLKDFAYSHYYTNQPKVGISDIAEFIPIFGKLATINQIEGLIY